jgi:hypothetical protein
VLIDKGLRGGLQDLACRGVGMDAGGRLGRLGFKGKREPRAVDHLGIESATKVGKLRLHGGLAKTMDLACPWRFRGRRLL